jgi:hypothetical protein
LNEVNREHLRDSDGDTLDNPTYDQLYVVYHALFFELGSWTAIPLVNVIIEVFFTAAFQSQAGLRQ